MQDGRAQKAHSSEPQRQSGLLTDPAGDGVLSACNSRHLPPNTDYRLMRCSAPSMCCCVSKKLLSKKLHRWRAAALQAPPARRWQLSQTPATATACRACSRRRPRPWPAALPLTAPQMTC